MAKLIDKVGYGSFYKSPDSSNRIIREKDVSDFIKSVCEKIIAKQGATDYVLNGNELIEFIKNKAGDALLGEKE